MLSTPIRSGLAENMECDSGKSLAATKLLPEVEGVQEKVFKTTASLSHPRLATSHPFLQGCGYCIIIQANKQSNIAFNMCWGCMWRGHTCIYRGVYLWVRSMGAKSSKWCHQANWRLIKACWSAPIKLSTAFWFQTRCRSLLYMLTWETYHRKLDCARALDCRTCHTIYLEVNYIQMQKR